MKLNNKVYIITGAGSGIGRAGALLFSKEGSKVVVADIDVEEGERTVNMIKSRGGDALFVQTDITKLQDVQHLINQTINYYGKLNVLWSNAGIVHPFSPIEKTSNATFDKVMSVNVKGPWNCVNETIPIFKRSGNGIIIFTTSLSGLKARENFALYQASKGAIIMLTKSLAKELAPYQIRVNLVCPGLVDTPILDNLVEQDIGRTKKEMISSIPMKRLATPEEIAQAALFLAQEESSYITGVNLPIDGGALA